MNSDNKINKTSFTNMTNIAYFHMKQLGLGFGTPDFLMRPNKFLQSYEHLRIFPAFGIQEIMISLKVIRMIPNENF